MALQEKVLGHVKWFDKKRDMDISRQKMDKIIFFIIPIYLKRGSRQLILARKYNLIFPMHRKVYRLLIFWNAVHEDT